jgi:hypothetical protein
VLTWTPPEAQGPGTYTITVQVTDNNPDAVNAKQLSDTNSFSVTVREVNRPPSLVGPGPQTIDEMTLLIVTNYATDPDLPVNTLVFALVSAPPGVLLNATNGVLTWMPTEAQGPSTNTLTLEVTDNGVPPLVVTNSFIVVVREVNRAPVLAPIPDQTAYPNVLLTLTNAVTDPDLPTNTLQFSLTGAPAGMVIDADSGVLRWTPTPDQIPGTNRVTVQVTDNGVPPRSDARSFTVEAHPLPSLTIAQLPGHALLAWPTYARGFALQSTTNVAPTAEWTNAASPPAVIGDLNVLADPLEGAQRYYRLRHP